MSDVCWIECKTTGDYWLQVPLSAIEAVQCMPSQLSFYDKIAGTAWLSGRPLLRNYDPNHSDAFHFFYALGLDETEAMEQAMRFEIVQVPCFEREKLSRFFDQVDFDRFLSSLANQ